MFSERDFLISSLKVEKNERSRASQISLAFKFSHSASLQLDNAFSEQLTRNQLAVNF